MPPSSKSIRCTLTKSAHDLRRDDSIRDLIGKTNPFRSSNSSTKKKSSSSHYPDSNDNVDLSCNLKKKSSQPWSGIKKKIKKDKKKDSNHTTTSICASGMDRETLMEQIKTLSKKRSSKKKKIGPIEIEDFVLTAYDDEEDGGDDQSELLSMVKNLAFQAEKFSFVDEVAMEDVALFFELRDDMMQEYEQASWSSSRHGGNQCSSSNLDQITWKAVVPIAQGTSLEDVLDLLVLLQEDLDVIQVSFEGCGDVLPSIPKELCKLVNPKSWTIMSDDVIVKVTSGWGDDDDWLQLLQECVQSLSELCGLGCTKNNSKAVSSSCEFEESESSVDLATATFHHHDDQGGCDFSVNAIAAPGIVGHITTSAASTTREGMKTMKQYCQNDAGGNNEELRYTESTRSLEDSLTSFNFGEEDNDFDDEDADEDLRRILLGQNRPNGSLSPRPPPRSCRFRPNNNNNSSERSLNIKYHHQMRRFNHSSSRSLTLSGAAANGNHRNNNNQNNCMSPNESYASFYEASWASGLQSMDHRT